MLLFLEFLYLIEIDCLCWPIDVWVRVNVDDILDFRVIMTASNDKDLEAVYI